MGRRPMTFFVDADVIFYAGTDGEYRGPCLEVLEAVARGDADGCISPTVLQEVRFVERSGRAGRLDGLASYAYRIFTPLLSVTDEAVRLALALRAPGLGPADRLHAGTCLANGIKAILTTDAAFGGVPDLCRVDPLDASGLRRLLTPRLGKQPDPGRSGAVDLEDPGTLE